MGGTRASYYFGAMSVLWLASGLIQIIPPSLRNSVPLISALVAGLIAGAVGSVVFSRRQLRVLVAKSEAKIRFVTLLLWAGALCIACGVLLLVVGASVEMLLVAWMFVLPLNVTALATSAFVFFSWELKNKRVILLRGLLFTKLYVFPEVSRTAVQ